MEDTLSETSDIGNHAGPENAGIENARALKDLLHEHKGENALMLDLREMGAWTDFFVIATVTSSAHMDGLERHIKEFCDEQGVEILRRSRKPTSPGGVNVPEDEWRIIDLGSTVIHLMSRKAREFYDLERLYLMAKTEPPNE